MKPAAQHGSCGPTAADACDDCGYPLDGLPEDARCPECGRDLATLRAPLGLFRRSISAKKVIRWHEPCARCGYDLFSLLLGADCPECGLPIADTFGGRLLRYAPVRSVRRLSRAVDAMLFGFVMTLPLACAPPVGWLGLLAWDGGMLLLAAAADRGAPGRVPMAWSAWLLLACLLVVPAGVVGWAPGAVGLVAGVIGSAALAIAAASSLMVIRAQIDRLASPSLKQVSGALLWTSFVLVAAVVWLVMELSGAAIDGRVTLAVALTVGAWAVCYSVVLLSVASAVRDELLYARAIGSGRGQETPRR